MAYFNHAFEKAFLGTGISASGVSVTKLNNTTMNVATDGGYVTTDGMPTYGLNQLKAAATPSGVTNNGYFGIFNPKTNLTITPSGCCNVYLAGSAIYANDKIGPLAGGYQETNKSKDINPKYVSRFYEVAPCAPQNNVIHVGKTYWTEGLGVATFTIDSNGNGYDPSFTPVIASGIGGTGSGATFSFLVNDFGQVYNVQVVSPGFGYTANDILLLPGSAFNMFAQVTVQTLTGPISQTGCGITNECCKEFLCGETYYLRLDVKGSPALRFLDHNAYATVDAYTGCCDPASIAPTVVDSTTVMIAWANGIVNNPIVSPFIQPVVQTEAGALLYAPGTSADFLAANGAITWDNYVSPGHVDGACAGIILNGAYVDTRFGDCTFQVSDFYEKEPVKLYASEVDLNGDPCTFSSICVVTECAGLQVQGIGETVLRELTLSESYRQNFLATDFRIREITQGNQIVDAIDRQALYYRYVLIHNVPRFNNPTGVFDNDQYALTIFSKNALPTFFNNVDAWLTSCGAGCEIEQFGCETNCTPAINFPAIPPYNPYNVVSCN
jgi:hypothetical protein